MTKLAALCALLFLWAGADGTLAHAPVHPRVGDCTLSTVTYVGWRAGDSGIVIQYANDMWQVDYNTIPGIHASRAGDRVRLCLIELPLNCPAGDDRGRIYKGTNLRTGASWNAMDSQHSCGGA